MLFRSTRQRDRNAEGSLVPLITSLNRIRCENAALQSNLLLHFHGAENEKIICYSKVTSNYDNVILVAVNLDPFNEQASWIQLDLKKLGLAYNQDFVVEDLLTDSKYNWHGEWNYVALKPDVQPAHIFRIVRNTEPEP